MCFTIQLQQISGLEALNAKSDRSKPFKEHDDQHTAFTTDVPQKRKSVHDNAD